MGKTVYNGFEPFSYAAQLKESKMKNLILIELIFLIACGSGSEDTLERPSVSSPDETEDDTPQILVQGQESFKNLAISQLWIA